MGPVGLSVRLVETIAFNHIDTENKTKQI